MTQLVVMEGDGIGPEIGAVTVEVLREADRRFSLGLKFTTAAIGLTALRDHGTTFPVAAFEAAQSADGVILGPVSHNDYPAVAQAQHGSAPDIAGQDRANPASLIGSAAMLLEWIGERRNDDRFSRAAAAIEDALERTISDPAGRTRDLGGPLGTKAFGDRVVARLRDL